MDEKETILTPEGLRKLEEELEFLKSVKRKEIAERIKQAKEFGDLMENSEYEDAKNEQAFTEGRILTLEGLLRNAKVIDNHDVRSDVVTIGSTVRLVDDAGEELTYTIVGSAEADPAHDRISNESPVGRALLGRRKGETVTVEVPAGTSRRVRGDVGVRQATGGSGGGSGTIRSLWSCRRMSASAPWGAGKEKTGPGPRPLRQESERGRRKGTQGGTCGTVRRREWRAEGRRSTLVREGILLTLCRAPGVRSVRGTPEANTVRVRSVEESGQRRRCTPTQRPGQRGGHPRDV